MPSLRWLGGFERRDLIGLGAAIALLIALPLVVKEAQRRQIVNTRAEPAGEITINNGAQTTNTRSVRVRLSSPYGARQASAQSGSSGTGSSGSTGSTNTSSGTDTNSSPAPGPSGPPQSSLLQSVVRYMASAIPKVSAIEACLRDDVVGTATRCNTDQQQCTVNKHLRENGPCNGPTYDGGFYGCNYVDGQCGYTAPPGTTPVPATPVPATPNPSTLDPGPGPSVSCSISNITIPAGSNQVTVQVTGSNFPSAIDRYSYRFFTAIGGTLTQEYASNIPPVNRTDTFTATGATYIEVGAYATNNQAETISCGRMSWFQPTPSPGPVTSCKAVVSKSANGPWQTERGDYIQGEKAWVAVVDNNNQPIALDIAYSREMTGSSGWRMAPSDFSGKPNPVQSNDLGGPGEYAFRLNCPGNQTATARAIVPATQQATGTRGYKIANTLAGLGTAEERSYTSHPLEIDWTLSEGEGAKTVYVKFIRTDSTESDVSSATIAYAIAGPNVSQIACRRDITQGGGQQNAGWLLTLSGSNFGDQGQAGSVRLGSTALDVVNWSSSSIVARYAQRQLPTANTSVRVTRSDSTGADGTLDPARCSRLGTATLTIRSRLQRRPTNDFSGDYKIVVREKDTNRKVHERRARFNRGGQIETGLDVDAGELYSVWLKGPQHLAKRQDFTPIVGANTVEVGELTAGDIDGSSCEGDNIVNSVDLGKLGADWSLSSDVDSCADFNRDKRVNSLDYWVIATNYLRQSDREDQ